MTSDRRRITRMIGRFVKADSGAQARIAALTGYPESTVAHWFSDDALRQYSMPVDVLPDVVDALGKVEIYAAIVAENDLEQPAPRARPTSNPQPLFDSMSKLFLSAGEVSAEICAAGAEIDEAEAERIHAKGLQARAVLDAILSRLPRRS